MTNLAAFVLLMRCFENPAARNRDPVLNLCASIRNTDLSQLGRELCRCLAHLQPLRLTLMMKFFFNFPSFGVGDPFPGIRSLGALLELCRCPEGSLSSMPGIRVLTERGIAPSLAFCWPTESFFRHPLPLGGRVSSWRAFAVRFRAGTVKLSASTLSRKVGVANGAGARGMRASAFAA